MGDTSIEVQLALLGERFGHIQRELVDAKASRKEQYETLEKQNVTLLSIENRVVKVEESLKQQAPTIEEFITIKHKVVGAGIAGKWIWGALAFLIGLAFGFRTEIIKWLTRS